MVSGSERRIRAGPHTITVKRPDKPLFPSHRGTDAITKGQVVGYYRRIAETLLPHLEGRPVSLQRCPDGIEDCFFQKNMPDHFPEWIARASLPAEGKTVEYLVIRDLATLVYIADQAAIALHVGLSRVDRPKHPDRLIFDLDPSGEDFSQVRWAAGVMRRAFDTMEMPSFLMTTGSRGLHVVVPLDRSANFDESRDFARQLAEELAARYPDRLTVEQRKKARKGRLFLDYLRNAYGQTTIAPYSLRTLAGAPVAAPLEWNELNHRLRPDRWTLDNIFRRLAQREDPFTAIGRGGVAIEPERLDRL
jgi:bifunctional non-homologous end joining protein LigD